MLLSAALVVSLLGSPDLEPATHAAKRLLALVDEIDRTQVEGAYQHRTRIRRREGVFLWDCSGMMTWMLSRVAPRARDALDRDRPVAATYHRAIKHAPVRRARDGWQRITNIGDVRPGDVFAWLRPPTWPKGGNTGHVGIIVEPPRPVPELDNAWAVRIVDASRYTHEDDTRDPDEDGGFGMGTILFVTDANGSPVGYGWFGTRSRTVHETSIVLGRVSR